MRDVMNVAGWVKDITVTNKGYAAMNLLIHEVLTKRKFAIDQIRRGLDCLEVLSLIQKYPDEMKEYFVKADKAGITPDVMIREVFANANGKEDSQYFVEPHKAVTGLPMNMKAADTCDVTRIMLITVK